MNNEVLDCFFYGFAAANHPQLRVQTMREIDWRKREEEYEPMVRDLFSTPLLVPEPVVAKGKPVRAGARVSQPQTNDFGRADWCL